MRKKQQGIIFTNDNCIGCNKCLNGCPIPGANRTEIVDGKSRIVVDGNRCIRCGKCLSMCVHNARDFMDDTEAFFTDIKTKDISVIMAPAFFLLYPKRSGKVINYLKSIGVKHVYDGGFGADIAVWAYLKYMDEHPEGRVITQSCSALVTFAEKYAKNLLDNLIPVQSPAVCTAIYVHKYLKRNEHLAFLGPCLAKKDEFSAPGTHGEIEYNITFKKLQQAIDTEIDDFSNEYELETSGDMGKLFPLRGGFDKNISNFIDDKFIYSVDDGRRMLEKIEDNMRHFLDAEEYPFLTDILVCERGCINGPGVDMGNVDSLGIESGSIKLERKLSEDSNPYYSNKLDADEKKKNLYEKFSELNPDDFKRGYENKYRPNRKLPASVVNEILESMHKVDEEKRHIDCGSCGYRTCIDMANSVAMCYSRKENCVHYEKDENERLYLTDSMTGIPNSTFFNQHMKNLIERGRGGEFAAICINLTEWELVNNRFGYQNADRSLVELAEAMCRFIEEDEMVAHQGGVVFQAVIRKRNLNRFIHDIEGVKIHPNVNKKELEIGISFIAGIYMIQNNDNTVGDIITRINIAAAEAKDGDIRIVYFNQEMRDKLISSMETIEAFPDAVKNNEFLVYYQPKVNAKERRLVGTEALVRWRKDLKDGISTVISPGVFIPIFEQNGFIRQLDFYVLETVCRDIRRWIDEGIEPVCVSVNFSKKHFSSESIADDIKAIVDKYSVPHELVEIEVTETAYEGRKDILKNVLKLLKKEGFSTSIDDFGSGYSSLNILSNLEFQVLKLDKEFLDPGVGNVKVQSIVESVIDMAKKLEMKVVAEGVELQEELDMLQSLSCDIIQGYYFDRPMPSDDFEKRLKNKDYYSL